ncbi:MAG: hypothetical protein A2901_01595 [Elusimicrobia bacterium RIFCSPLOWO2_01_FULL_54_10]|nr:MAG: hypothetical protein A2901_01595 [Elusimicrobia bacterium RIFCSPLOWO2_01_FULL_54_10]
MFWTLLEVVAHISNIAGAAGGIVAAVGVFKMLAAQSRAAEPVRVQLRLAADGRSVELPVHMRRRDITRAELLGRLGMLPMKQKGARFSLRALSTPSFMEAVNEVQEGNTSVLVIPATMEELDQFDI